MAWDNGLILNMAKKRADIGQKPIKKFYLYLDMGKIKISAYAIATNNFSTRRKKT